MPCPYKIAWVARGGWVVFEALPPALRGRLDPWGFSEPSLRLKRGVKRALDPTGVFSPGRFVGDMNVGRCPLSVVRCSCGHTSNG